MRGSTLILLLLLTVITGTQAVVSWGNASFTMIDSYYYIVSKNNSYISVQSGDKTFETCDLEFIDSHVGRVQVAAVDRKILLLYRHSSLRFKLLQIDPFLCLFNPLPSLETSVESTLEPQLIRVDNTLDIYLNGHENCLPCRFDVNGYRLEVTGQLPQSEISLFKSFIVKEFMPKEQVRNYALVGNFADKTAVLKILDHHFSTVKEIYFNHQIEGLAANSGSNQSWIGITYAGLGNPYERVLAMFTMDLELIFETRVKHDYGYKIYNTLLAINSTGHSFINFINASPVSSNRFSSYTVYNSKGAYVTRADIDSLLRTNKYDSQLFLYGEEFFAAIHDYQSSKTVSNLKLY